MSLDVPITSTRNWFSSSIVAWDQFWFTPRLPQTVAVLRIITGLMLLYSHLVLATDLMSFVGDRAWINNETARQLHDGAFGYFDWGRSYLWYLSNPILLWLHHTLTILVTVCFAAGLMTRITAPAAWFLQLMYLHRLTGTLFGLDQIVTYAAMYLMLAPCGSWLSVDAWLRKRMAQRRSASRFWQWMLPEASPSVATNIATRLLQLHLCVIYLFGGLAKARGVSWWDGTAMWYSIGNYEYQTLDMTWLAAYPRVFSALTHVTLFWEVFYCALIWPRITRPLALGMAVAVHGGIAMFLGMITFGVMMIAANLIFIEPTWLRRLVSKGGGEGEEQAWDDESWAAAEVWEDDEELVLEDDSSKSSIGVDSGILVGGDGSLSGISPAGNSLSEADRQAKLRKREQELQVASKRLNDRSAKLKTREATYRERVERLKQREAKIKNLVERRRQGKSAGESEQQS